MDRATGRGRRSQTQEVVFGLIEIALGLLGKERKEIDGLLGQRQVNLAASIGVVHLPQVDED
jgi:hypothetical protein